MKKVYRFLLTAFLILPFSAYGQLCNGFISTASTYDAFFFSYDTLCVGNCQKYWVTNAGCPEFTGAGFHWVFFGGAKNDTLVGDTVYHCFTDTGTFRMDIYASEFRLDSAHNLNGANVILPCPPVAAFTVNEQVVCINQSVTFTDKSTGGVNNWQWTFEGGSPASYQGNQPPPVYYSDTGWFFVQLAVSSPYGTSDIIKTSFIHVLPGPTPVSVQHLFIITEGDSVGLSACATGNNYNWGHAPAIIANYDTAITVQPEESENYVLTVTENGCYANCNYTVYVKNGLLVPTAFSPNKDGVNDAFRILNNNIELLSLRIYNRWGELVFTTSNLQDGWDGAYKNVLQPIGSYVWVCEYQITKTGKRKNARGNVTLVR